MLDCGAIAKLERGTLRWMLNGGVHAVCIDQSLFAFLPRTDSPRTTAFTGCQKMLLGRRR